jgi:hypothetical protein
VTPERMTDLVGRWVRFYTRNLPAPAAERRRDEIEADLHDHIAHERANGTKDRRIAFSIAARMFRGMHADISWGGKMTGSPVVRIALVTGLILLVPPVAMQFTDEVDWGVFDFVFAGILLGGGGLLLHRLAASKAGNVVYGALAGATGVAAIVLGEADDAPGLVLFGLLLILATVALVARTALRSE